VYLCISQIFALYENPHVAVVKSRGSCDILAKYYSLHCEVLLLYCENLFIDILSLIR
jgi:hypothetical protein